MMALLIVLCGTIAMLAIVNIRPASEIVCRILCGFAVLIALNTVLGLFFPIHIGVNIVTASVVGVFGLPGSIMLLGLSLL